MRFSLLIGIAILSLGILIPVQAQKGPKPAPPSYTKQVDPLLKKHCVSCHRAEAAYGGLRLDAPEGVKKAVVPKDPKKSSLSKRMKGEGPMMPPAGKLKEADIKVVDEWIKSGAQFK